MLEHEFIRKRLNEPRIHFALVCAAISCPSLRTNAYIGESLNYHLEEQRVRSLIDQDRNYYDKASNTIYLSKLFSWFAADIEKAVRTTPQSVLTYVLPVFFSEGTYPDDVKVKFLPYD